MERVRREIARREYENIRRSTSSSRSFQAEKRHEPDRFNIPNKLRASQMRCLELLPSKFRNPSHKIASLRSILKRKRARSRFVHYFTKTKRETKRNGKKGRSRRCHEEGERNLSALFSIAVSRKLIFDSISQNDGEWRGRRIKEKEGDGGKASRLPPSLLLPSPSPSHHPPSMDRPCWIH